MAKQTLSLRVPESSMKQIAELKSIFDTSASEVVELAVNYFYDNRESAAKSIAEQLTSRAKPSK